MGFSNGSTSELVHLPLTSGGLGTMWIHGLPGAVPGCALGAALLVLCVLLLTLARGQAPGSVRKSCLALFVLLLVLGVAAMVEGLTNASRWRMLDGWTHVLASVMLWVAACLLASRLSRVSNWLKDAVDAKRHKIELERLRDRFRSVIESSPVAKIIIDDDGRIMFVNRTTSRLFGYVPEELVGHPVEDLIPERFHGQHRDHVGGYFRTPVSRATGEGRDLAGMRKDGTEVPIEIALTPMPEWGRSTADGEPVRAAMATVIDISHRKLAERALKLHSEALERQNEELNQFTYIASHDLQEPLRKLISFSTLLKSDLGGDLPKCAEDDLHYITDAARRMETLIQALLQLSRSSHRDLSLRRVAIGECVRQALDTLEPRIEETKAEVEIDELPCLEVDAPLLVQTFQNLIGNALKYRAPQRPPRIEITAEHHGNEWEFGVRDNGIGIEEEYWKRIFAPFQRLHGRGKYEGTGIGLAICQKVVQRHGGRLWVESDPGEGSHFKFTISCEKELSHGHGEASDRDCLVGG